jgi:hypothetical protein
MVAAVAATTLSRALRPMFRLIPVLVAAACIVASAFLWGPALANARAGTPNSVDLGLFALAGGLGATLRSIAYLLASASFTTRQGAQWRLETLVSPVLGAVAGSGAYLVVLSTVVQAGGINPAGQYLVSLLAGTSALTLFGRIAERGLLRSGTNRSGILGGEVSPSVPMLQRIDALLEQRVSDLTIVDYGGFALVASRPISPRHWEITVRFFTDPREISDVQPRSEVRPVEVRGGSRQDSVPFLLSVAADRVHAVPSQLTASVPSRGISPDSTLVVELIDVDLGDSERLVAVVQIGQGTQILQAVPIRLDFR